MRNESCCGTRYRMWSEPERRDSPDGTQPSAQTCIWVWSVCDRPDARGLWRWWRDGYTDSDHLSPDANGDGRSRYALARHLRISGCATAHPGCGRGLPRTDRRAGASYRAVRSGLPHESPGSARPGRHSGHRVPAGRHRRTGLSGHCLLQGRASGDTYQYLQSNQTPSDGSASDATPTEIAGTSVSKTTISRPDGSAIVTWEWEDGEVFRQVFGSVTDDTAEALAESVVAAIIDAGAAT